MGEGAEIVVVTDLSAGEERGINAVEALLCQDARRALRLEPSVQSSYLGVGEASLGGERNHTLRSVSAGTEIL